MFVHFRQPNRLVAGLLAIIVTLAAGDCRAQESTRPVLIFAAASLTNALNNALGAMPKAPDVGIKVSYAASSALARQLEAGAPADLFISADLEWMDYAAGKGLIQPGSRISLLGNTLVLIAPATSAVSIDLKPGLDLKGVLAGRRLAIGDPDHVPAGRYGKAALISLGVWDSVAASLARAENVRAALAYVARGETPLGIVYSTDAREDPRVRVVGTFPATSYSPIVYPAALTVRATPVAQKVLEHLRSPEARRIFAGAGFIAVD